MRCPSCASEVQSDANFCPVCGSEQGIVHNSASSQELSHLPSINTEIRVSPSPSDGIKEEIAQRPDSNIFSLKRGVHGINLAGLLILGIAIFGGYIWIFNPFNRAEQSNLRGSKELLTSRRHSQPVPPWVPSDIPEVLKRDAQDLRNAILTARERLKLQNLQLDLHPKLWKGTKVDAHTSKMSWDFREIFTNPYIIWGRDPITERWDAVMAVSDLKKGRMTLCWFRDALGKADLFTPTLADADSDFVLNSAWSTSGKVGDVSFMLKEISEKPISDFRWGLPSTSVLVWIALHPEYGLAVKVDSVEGIDSSNPDDNTVSITLIRDAVTVLSDGGRRWFKSGVGFYFCLEDAWQQWQLHISKQTVRSQKEPERSTQDRNHPTKKETIDFIKSLIADYETARFDDDGDKFIFRRMCDITTVTLARSTVEIVNRSVISFRSTNLGIYQTCVNKQTRDTGHRNDCAVSLANPNDPNNAKLADAFKHLAELKTEAANRIQFK